MDSQTTRGESVTNGENADRVRSFLVEHGIAPADDSTERDDRIFYAGLTCIELAMRPYERRLLRRATHDADRVETLLRELHGEPPIDQAQDVLTPAAYREFVGILERDLHPDGEGGPVPTLFRSGAFLIAASFNPADPTIGRCAQRDTAYLKATLEFLDDLLNWVEAGRRGDRLETLEEAQSRLDAVEQQVSGHYDDLRVDIRSLADLVTENRAATSVPIDNLTKAVDAMSERTASIEAALTGLQGRLDPLADVDHSIAALSEALSAIDTRLQRESEERERHLDELAQRIATGSNQDTSAETMEGIAQLRSLALAGLAGIAVVGILVIVAISLG